MFGLFGRKKEHISQEQRYFLSVSRHWEKLKQLLASLDAHYEYTEATKVAYFGRDYFRDNHAVDLDVNRFLLPIRSDNPVGDYEVELKKAVLQHTVLLAVCLKECVKPLIGQHITTLMRKEKMLVLKDDYGNYQFDKWDKEVDYFYQSTLASAVHDWYDRRPSQLISQFDLPDSGLLASRSASLSDRVGEEIQLAFYSLMNNVIDSENIMPETSDYHPALSGTEYEYFVAELVESAGFTARVTQASGDHGVDIIAGHGNLRIAIQCKHYASKVGNKAVQEVYSAKDFYDCNAAMVVTNNMFTPQAREAAAKLGVALFHHEQLVEFLTDVIRDDQ